MSLWTWVVAVDFTGSGLCMVVVLANCYCFKRE